MGGLSIWHWVIVLVVLLLIGGAIVVFVRTVGRLRSTRAAPALRVVNGAVWFGAWVATAIHDDSFDNPARMVGEAVFPAVLCLVLDMWLRRKRPVPAPAVRPPS